MQAFISFYFRIVVGMCAGAALYSLLDFVTAANIPWWNPDEWRTFRFFTIFVATVFMASVDRK